MNTRISVWNSFLRYLGRREWQIVDFEREVVKVQPRLSRTEYLRLLSAAKQLDKEKTYLLIKTLGGAGMRIQELPQLTLGFTCAQRSFRNCVNWERNCCHGDRF